MSNTITGRRILSHLAAGVLAVGLATTLAAPASADATTPPPPPPPAGAPVSAEATPIHMWHKKDLVLNRYKHDGVKGTIKNFTSHTIRVADPMQGTEGVYTLVEPGQQVTYYNCRHFEYRDGRDILLEGHGSYLWISRADGRSTTTTITLSDPFVGRPDTYFSSGPIRTLRTGWSTNESHHEVTPDASFTLKREKDGWNGGHETEYTSDWAVFSVHVDKI